MLPLFPRAAIRPQCDHGFRSAAAWTKTESRAADACGDREDLVVVGRTNAAQCTFSASPGEVDAQCKRARSDAHSAAREGQDRMIAQQSYNSGMATSRTPDEMLQDYTAAMGPKLGPAFHRLYNDNAWLHMKWNEFLKLFVKSPAQMRELNTAASGFFHQVQELWWDDMLLHIFRMTDKRTDVLSVHTLLREAPASLKPTIESHIAVITPATEFARHARHNSIAHRNLNVALGVTPLTLGSRNDIRGALKAIDDLLHAIEFHFLKTNPTNYDFLDNIGGVDSLLDIVDRGLKSRDAQFGYFRSSHPPDPS